MHERGCVHTYCARTGLCVHVLMYTCKLIMCARTYTHTHIHTYTHTCIHTYMHTHIHTYMHTHIHTYTHTHIHTDMHTCIHAYTSKHAHTPTHTNIRADCTCDSGCSVYKCVEGVWVSPTTITCLVPKWPSVGTANVSVYVYKQQYLQDIYA